MIRRVPSRLQKKASTVSHADDWLMTYADMITLLLCFFAIFLTISLPKKDVQQKLQPPHPIEEPAAVAMVQPAPPPPPPPMPVVTQDKPDYVEGNLPLHGVEHAEQPTEDGSYVPEPAASRPDPFAVVGAAPTEVAPEKPAEVTASPAEAAPADAPVADAAPAMSTPVASLQDIISQVKTQGNASIEQKGNRITTLDMDSAAFFGSGSATLSASGKAILMNVARQIQSDAFRDYQVTVEGHTDDAPIDTKQFPSNWELSTARAAAVVHFFLDQGVPAKKLRAAGYADSFPVAPNRDAHGNPIPANQARNRRVVIKLEKIDKSE